MIDLISSFLFFIAFNQEGRATIIAAIIAAIITLMASIISLAASLFSSKKSNDVAERLGKLEATTQDKQRLIDTISAQRVEWINNVRENFSKLSKTTYIMATMRSKDKEIPDDVIQELTYLVNHIELFLNPSETITKKFTDIKDETSKYLIHNDDFLWEEYEKSMFNLHYIQQVILKAEWKRLKEETKRGNEISDKEMEELHRSTAEKIDPNRYISLLKEVYDDQS